MGILLKRINAKKRMKARRKVNSKTKILDKILRTSYRKNMHLDSPASHTASLRKTASRSIT